jgi:Tfp pilus assembly protein PilF
MAGQTELAMMAGRRAIELNPANSFARIFHAYQQALTGNYSEAVAALRTAEQLVGETQSGFLLGLIAIGYGLAMSPEDAGRVFGRVVAVADERRIGPGSWAAAYLGIGDEARALEQLEMAVADKAADDGAYLIGLLKQNVFGANVLEQPEFVEVRSRLGFRE